MSQFPLPNSSQRAGSRREKIALAPGHSLMDWIRLSKSGKDLCGTGPRLLQVTTEELAKHCTKQDAWMAIRGKVYNVTSYMSFHPGGVDQLMQGVGKDATQLFDSVHRWVNVDNMLQACLVGKLIGTTPNIKPIKQQTLSTSLDIPTQSLSKVSKQTTKLQVPVMLPPPITSNLLKSIEKTSLEVDAVYEPKNHVSWTQTADSVTICHTTNFDIEYFSCDIIDNFSKVLLEIFPSSKNESSYIGCIIQLDSVVKSKIISLKNDSGKIEVVLCKEKSKQWSNLGDIKLLPDKFKSFKRTCTLQSKSQLTENTALYELKLPETSRLIIPTGGHVYLEIDVENVQVSRPYTVIYPSLLEAKHTSGVCDKIYLMIKSYQLGLVTSKLNCYEVGDEVKIFTRGEGRFDLKKLKDKKQLLLICAGTGFTPMIKVMHHCFHQCKNIQMCVLFFNRHEKDIIWYKELQQIIKLSSGCIKVEHILSESSEDWKGLRGTINQQLLTKYVLTDEKSMTFVCGSVSFTNITLKLLRSLDVQDHHVHAFT